MSQRPSSKVRNKTKRDRSESAGLGSNGTNQCMTVYPFFDPKTGQFDIKTSFVTVDPNDMTSAALYFDSHWLMPYGYCFDPIRDRYQVEEAAGALDRIDATDEELLRAIAILGHSPCKKALETLNRWSNTTHRHAPVARVALSECTEMAHFLEDDEVKTGIFLRTQN
jgi:hypothetical protein